MNTENSAGPNLCSGIAVDADGWEAELDAEPAPTGFDPDTGKLLIMSRRCGSCVFSGPGQRLDLGPGRLKELTDDIRGRGDFLLCHASYKPLGPPGARTAACRGYADAFGTESTAIRIARLLGLYLEIDPPASTDPDHEPAGQEPSSGEL